MNAFPEFHMPGVRGLLCIVLFGSVVATLPAQEVRRNQLLVAVERQLQHAVKTAGPSIACVVVSRSELYPKTPGASETPGKLGTFDPKAFVKEDPSAEREKLARSLDISKLESIPDHGFAGGVVIDDAGFVLTPYHVIDGATRVFVFLPDGKGSYADIHAADARSDLAVLKLITPPQDLRAIKFGEVRTFTTRTGEPNVVAGKLVVLMANPHSAAFDGLRPSAAFGSITNVRHRILPPPTNPNQRRAAEPRASRYAEYGSLLEYDVRLNSGVSGGVLLNLDSEMIGLTNAAALAWGKEVGPGYAVPADQNFRRIVEVLRRGEEVEYGFMGVLRVGDQPASRIVNPMPGGAAARAQLRAGDVISRINGIAITSFNDLLLHVGSALAGSKVVVTVDRVGGERDLEVTLAKYLNDQPFIASVRPAPVFGMRVDHASILAQRLSTDTYVPAGVCVREVAPDSPAAKAFKALADVPPTSWLITKVNGNAVSKPVDFYEAAKGQESLKLTIADPAEKPPQERELIIP